VSEPLLMTIPEGVERIAVALERLVALMERAADERDEPPVRLPGVILDRGKRVA